MIFPAGTKLFSTACKAKLLNRPGDLARADEAEAREIPPLLAYLESVTPAKGFLVGDSLTIGDIAVVNQLVNLAYSACHVDAARYPRLAAYYMRLTARPSIAGLIAADRAMLGL
jgi:glutathione S-transferase